MIELADILRIRLAAPSERYQRFARRANAEAFAHALAAIPGVGADVFRGAPGTVVTLHDDRPAADAAGAGRFLFSYRPWGSPTCSGHGKCLPKLRCWRHSNES